MYKKRNVSKYVKIYKNKTVAKYGSAGGRALKKSFFLSN